MVRGALGPAPPVEPITANKGAPGVHERRARAAAPPPGLPGGASGSLMSSRATRADGAASNPAGQRVIRRGQRRRAADPAAARPARAAGAAERPGADACPASARSTSTRRSRRSPRRRGDLVNIRALDARVTGQCSGGSPSLTGTWSIAGLSVLGVPIGTDRAAVADAHDRLALDRPLGPRPDADPPPGADLSAFCAALQPVLDALPNIAIPEALARLQVTPGQQVRSQQHADPARAVDLALDRGPERLQLRRRRGDRGRRRTSAAARRPPRRRCAARPAGSC